MRRCAELRSVHRERRVCGARVPGHRAGVVRRAGAVQRGPVARRALPAADVRQPDGADQPTVQRQPSARRPERVRRGRLGAVRARARRARAAAAPVRVPRVHIRAGHHHVRVHQELPAVPGVRFPERRVVVAVQQPVYGLQERIVRADQSVRVRVLLWCRDGDGWPAKTDVLRHPLEPEQCAEGRRRHQRRRRRRQQQHGRGDGRVVRTWRRCFAERFGDEAGRSRAERAEMPVLSGKGQDPGPRGQVLRSGPSAQGVLLLLPEARAGVRAQHRGRAPRQGAAVAVRRASEPRDTHQRSAVHGQRVEVVQLEHVVRAARALAVRRPPSDAEDHAQGAGTSAGVRRTAAAEKAAAQGRCEQRADQTLQVVVQPVPDP